MSFLDELFSHAKEVYGTLSHNERIRERSRGYADSVKQGLLSNFPMLAKSPLDVTAGDIIGSGIGAMPLTFGGKLARNAPLKQFDKAERMAKVTGLLGLPVGGDDWMRINEAIHGRTGIHYGADNMPRFEIDDSAARLNLDKIPAPKTAIQFANEYLWDNGVPKARDVGSSTVPPMLRQEALQYGTMKARQQSDVTIPASQAFSHGGLFRNYPDMGNIGVKFETSGTVRGSYSPNSNTLTLGGGTISDSGDMAKLSTGLHELQHGIQAREGFTSGGSPTAINDAYNLAKARLHFLEQDPNYLEGSAKLDDLWNKAFVEGSIPTEEALWMENEIKMQYPELRDADRQMSVLRSNTGKTYEDAFKVYQRLGGEAEARAAQKRIGLTPEQRAARFPLLDYDVPISDLITGDAYKRLGMFER